METKKTLGLLAIVIAGSALIAGLVFYWNNLRGVGPIIKDPPFDIADQIDNPGENATDLPLKLPDNFKISIYARNLSGARMLAYDNSGNLWLSRTSAGVVSKLTETDGKVTSTDVFRGLRGPHGVAFTSTEPDKIFIAEEHRIIKANIDGSAVQKIADLPSGGGHSTRTIKFGPDNRLYVSIGSSCNVCREDDERRASMYSLNADGSDFVKFASGLRNTVFFTWSDIDGKLWGTDMGRDLLGDDTPPDEINVLEQGKFYGWPICYGKNIHDDNFDKNVYIRNPCMEPFEKESKVDLQAHSAPLGLDFVPEEGWPEEYWYDLIVAYHGSWNRSVPTGYKLVRIKLDDKGNYEGTEDFITGWISGNAAAGRPVDVMIQPGGTMLVTDDKAGLIYKINTTVPAQ